MRKLAAALLAYVMLNIVLACAAGAADFGDVSPDYWAREEIAYMTERGIFLGRTPETFGPESGMTRGQMTAVLYRLADCARNAIFREKTIFLHKGLEMTAIISYNTSGNAKENGAGRRMSTSSCGPVQSE